MRDQAEEPQESVGHIRQHRCCCGVPLSPCKVQGTGLCSEGRWQSWHSHGSVKSLCSLGVADNKPHPAAASLRAAQAVSQGVPGRGARRCPGADARAVMLLCSELLSLVPRCGFLEAEGPGTTAAACPPAPHHTVSASVFSSGWGGPLGMFVEVRGGNFSVRSRDCCPAGTTPSFCPRDLL